MRSSRISLATCTALCGGNTRLLWPRPTGNIILGDESVTMHLQQIEFVTVNTSDRDVKTLLEYAKDVFLGKIFKQATFDLSITRSQTGLFLLQET